MSQESIADRSRKIWRAGWWWLLLRRALKTWTIWAGLALGLWTIILFFADRERISRAQLLEAQKPFLELQFKTYTDFLTQLGDLLTHVRHNPDTAGEHHGENEKAWSAKELKFYQVYWGRMPVVEHEPVRRAREKMGERLRAFSASINKTKEQIADREVKRAALQLATQELGHTIRDSVQYSWSGSQKIEKSWWDWAIGN